MVCGCLAEVWGVRRSIQVVVMQVVLVACFDVCVRAGLLCASVPPFLCKVSSLVVRELRGVFLTCVGSLVGRLLLIRGREQVFDSSSFRLLCCLLSATGT